MLGEKFGHLGLDRLRQQGARPVTQHLGERVAERPWLKQLDDVSIGHGVSLLCWRSGGSNTPTIRRLLPVRPSPTSAYSSAWGGALSHSKGLSAVTVPWEATTAALPVGVTATRVVLLIARLLRSKAVTFAISSCRRWLTLNSPERLSLL